MDSVPELEDSDNEEKEDEEELTMHGQQKRKRGRDLQDWDQDQDQNRNEDQDPEVVVSYKNDQSTFKQFDFMADGGKWLVKKKEHVAYRRYYVCTNHKLTRCPAKYTVTEWPNGKVETEFDSDPHNHTPPSTSRMKRDIRERIKTMIDVGASLAVIQKKCVNEAALPLSSAEVPSMNQLKNAKYSAKNKMKGSLII
jgi:hypothetical protein